MRVHLQERAWVGRGGGFFLCVDFVVFFVFLSSSIISSSLSVSGYLFVSLNNNITDKATLVTCVFLLLDNCFFC